MQPPHLHVFEDKCAIPAILKLFSNHFNFSIKARADHLFSQPSSPGFRLNLRKDQSEPTDIMKVFRRLLRSRRSEIFNFWGVCLFFGWIFPVSCGVPGILWSWCLFPVVLVGVKVVNMEVKPLCLVHNGRFVDNGLQAQRVTHKKCQREGGKFSDQEDM